MSREIEVVESQPMPDGWTPPAASLGNSGPARDQHEVWMAINGGLEDGGCSCGAVRPEGGFYSSTFAEIGERLGEHLDDVLRRRRRV